MDIMELLQDIFANMPAGIEIVLHMGDLDECDEQEYSPYGPCEPAFPVMDMMEKVVFNDDATIVIWKDGVKTVVRKCETDSYDKEKAIAMAIVKRITGNTGMFNEIFKKFKAYDD